MRGVGLFDVAVVAVVVAAVPSVLVDLGAIAGTCVAVVALSRTPPVRWLARQLIYEPMTEWLSRVVGEEVSSIDGRLSSIEHELHPNDGSSMRDQVDATAEQVGVLSLHVNELRRNEERAADADRPAPE